MQIHELNQQQQVNEVDLVGPNSIFNVGKQVVKNPAALGKSSALGAAQQAAAQASAASSAATLTRQGYTVGGSAKPAVTIAQQLQKVKANPAVQQQIKNLLSQWLKQSAQLRKKPISEAVEQFNPRDLTDPKYASVLKAIQGQETAKSGAATNTPPSRAMSMQPYQVPGAGTNPTPATAPGYKLPAANDQAAQQKQNLELEKELTVWKEQFKQWSDQKLSTTVASMDDVRTDTVTASELDKALSNVAVAAKSGDQTLETSAVENYLNLAIAGIQTYINNSESKSSARTSRVSSATATADGTAEQQDQIKQQLAKIGITNAQLSALGTIMTQLNKGSNVVNDTGNPVLNAIAKMAGMKVQ